MQGHFRVFFMLMMLVASMLPAQNLVVTSPGNGQTFRFGQICRITWTKTADQPQQINILIRRENAPGSEPAVLTIARDTANDGAFDWAVPASLQPGRYYLRFKAPGLVLGESPVFVIASRQTDIGTRQDSQAQPAGLPSGATNMPGLSAGGVFTDFEMVDVERETGSGVIFARVRNKGNRAYSGPLTFLVFFDSRQLDPISVPVNLPAGQENRVNLMYYILPQEMVERGQVQVLVSADGDHKVPETDENNNSVSRLIRKTVPFYIKDMRVEVTPSQSTGPYPLPVKATIHLDIVGQGELELKIFDTNFAHFFKKFPIAGTGVYEFKQDLLPIRKEMMPPTATKPGRCRKAWAWCPWILVKTPALHADGGVQKSNVVDCYYELPQ